MEYRENSLTYEEYVSLGSSVGWNNFDEGQISNSISNSIYNITVIDNGRTIAMGRLIGDGIYFMIVDIVVNHEFQGMGIGTVIMMIFLLHQRKMLKLSAKTQRVL